MLSFKSIKLNYQFWLILGVMLLAITLRTYKIESIPSSLYYDEVDYGYQARSLIETGKDYLGYLSPFYVRSFNDIRTPIPAYLTVLTTLIFSTEELQVRMPFVLSGILVVLMVFLLMRLWTKNFWATLAVTLVFAISPWEIQFSRFSHEVGVMLAFYLVGIYFFFRFVSLGKFRNLVTSVVLISLTVYTYRTMSLYAPITLVILFLIYLRQIWAFGGIRVIGLIIISGVIILPFLYATTIGAPDQSRIAQLSVTSDPEAPIWVQVNRETDLRDRTDTGKVAPPDLTSKLFHNKPLSYLDSFVNNYFYQFSTTFLFTKGDGNNRHNVGQMGELYLLDILALISGTIFLLKNLKFKQYQFLALWLLTSPIPASITMDGAGHGGRLFIFSAPLLIMVGLGWYQLINYLRTLKYKKIYLGLLLTVYCLLVTNYLHRYFIHYPLESAKYFGYGFKQAVQTIKQVEGDYQRISMVASKDPPMIYYLFWSHTPPKYLQEYGANFSTDNIENKKLDKYKVVGLNDLAYDINRTIAKLDRGTLYLVTQSELNLDFRKDSPPESIKLVKLIKYPDNEVDFYLITPK